MKLEHTTNSNKQGNKGSSMPWEVLLNKIIEAFRQASPAVKALARQSLYRLLNEHAPQWELELAGQLRLFSNGGATAPKAELSKP